MWKVVVIEDSPDDLKNKYLDLDDIEGIVASKVFVPSGFHAVFPSEDLAGLSDIDISQVVRPNSSSELLNYLESLNADLYLMDSLNQTRGIFTPEVGDIVDLICESEHLKKHSIVVSTEPRIIGKAQQKNLLTGRKGAGLYNTLRTYFTSYYS